MNFRRFLLASSALTGTLALGCPAASAATFSLTNDVSTLTSAPTDINGAFDISGFLDTQANAGNAVTINSATMQVYGYSAANNTYVSTYAGSYTAGYYTYSYTYYYSYSCGWSTCYGSGTAYATAPYYGSNYTVQNGDSQADTVLVDFGDQQLSGDTSQPSTYSYADTGYTRTYTTTGHSSGNIADSAALSNVSMNDLLSNSMLSYLLSVTGGDFNTLSVQLNLDYTLSPLQVSQTPLPPAALLFGSGLGTLALASRLRRRKKLIGKA